MSEDELPTNETATEHDAVPTDKEDQEENEPSEPVTIPFEQMPIEQQLESVIAEREDFRNQFLRAHAEMDNFRKRTQREREEERKYASLRLVSDLLGPLDNLERAVQSAQAADASNESALVQGVSMVAKQIEDVLSQHGAVAIASVGEPFDPNIHEALQQVPTDEHPPMTVIQEFRRGYKMNDRVVRPSQVIVSSAPVEENSEPTTEN